MGDEQAAGAPYRRNELAPSNVSNRARAAGDASWVMLLAALPIVVRFVDFPAGSANVIVWVIAATASFAVFVYTALLFLIAMTHMKPQALRDRQHQSPGIFCAENFDASGQDVHRKFRRACMLLALACSLNGIVAIVFPL